MSGSVVQLSTDVANTVEILEDLSRQLKENQYEFAETFSKDCSSIINALQELDAVRVDTHHLLEAESITASALRHKLNTHTAKLEAEAAAAVGSARDSNKSHLQSLQDQLSSMSKEAASLVKKHEILELHNGVLVPELKKLQAKHDEQVKILNEKMMERTEMQIVLNESLGQLENTNDKISVLNDEMAQLEEKLAKKKEEAEIDKNKILQLIKDTKYKINIQNEENAKLDKELDEHQHEVIKTEMALEETCRLIEEVEDSIKKLEDTKEAMKVTISEQTSTVESLKVEEKEIEIKINEHTNDFVTKKQNQEEVINKLIEEIDVSTCKGNDLNVTYKKVKKEFKKAKDAFEVQNGALLSIRESVNSAKQSLMSESEDGVKYETEKKELEFRLNQLEETHKMNVQLLKEEIADVREKLAREKKTRQAVEESYKELQAQIHNQVSEQTEGIHMLNACLEKSEQEGNELSEKKEKLQCNIKNCKANTIVLTKELSDLEKHAKQRKLQLEEELTLLEDSVATLSEELTDCTDQLNELEPRCTNLEGEYTLITEQYENAKKNMIELKNYKGSLNDTCQRLQRDLEKMHIPQRTLRMDSLKCRAYTRKNLREQKVYMDEMEHNVKQKEAKLKTILMENEKLKQAIKQLEDDCAYLTLYCSNKGEKESSLQTKLQDIQDMLKDQWKNNIKIEKYYSEKDKEFLIALKDLQINGAEQINRLSKLSNQFDEEMKQFTDFIKRFTKSKTNEFYFNEFTK